MGDVISLREFIDNRNAISTVKVNTFCRLMKSVSDSIDALDKPLIRVNLDEIDINIRTGEIVFPDSLFSTEDAFDKTIAGFNTGISLMADRKSSKEHKRVSFALMVLGWYVNSDHSAVLNDMMVLENFNEYMSSVPSWLQDFFVNVFRKMDYDTSFGDYYKEKFTDKVRAEIRDAFSEYNLSDEQFNRVASLVAKTANRMIKEGEANV